MLWRVLMVLGELGREELKRDRPLELCILGFINDSHPAFPEFLEDFVMGNCLIDHHFSLLGRVNRGYQLTGRVSN